MADITLIRNVGLDDTATSGDTSTVGEPSVDAVNRQLFVTGNWYASRSTDNGASWTHVDPFNALPSTAGGFCCDQLTIHDDARGVWIWILQYSTANGTNVFRLAATRDADFPTGGWYWWDIGPQTLDGSWNNLWFDYPDAALTNDNLFVTFNVFDAADDWQRAVVMRFPLATIANAGTLIFNWWSTTDNGSLRLTQGAGGTMYWGSHNTTTQLRLFSWADGSNTISWWNIAVGEWSEDISSTAPNGTDWLERADSRITAGCVGAGLITFMWTSGSRQNRPHAYCRVVRLREANRQVADQPDIWSEQRAWAYPAAATNNAGVIGFTAFYGGVDRHPGHVVGARDDGAGTWRTRYSRLGSHSPNAGRWGDYLNCHVHGSAPETWIASGYTLEGGETRDDILPRAVHFELDTGAHWHPFHTSADRLRAVEAARNADGRLEVFGVAGDQSLWHTWQTSPNNGWSGWAPLHGPGDRLRNLVVANNADGRLEVFGTAGDDSIWQTWQTSPNNGWSGWALMHSAADRLRSLAVGRNADGRLEVFGVAGDQSLWHTWQTSPNNGWSGWAPLHGPGDRLRNLVVANNADGRLEVFGTAGDDSIWQTWQTSPNNGWSGWALMHSAADRLRSLAVGRNADGRLEVFGVAGDQSLWHTWQTSPNNGWSGWAPLHGPGDRLRNLVVANNADGRLEVFGTAGDDSIWQTWQTSPNNGWSGWALMHSAADRLRSLAVSRNADGRLEVVGCAGDDSLWHTWQVAPNNGWTE